MFKSFLPLLCLAAPLFATAQPSNQAFYTDDIETSVSLGKKPKTILSVLPPAEAGDKSKSDSLVFLGKYFVCFKSDKTYKELIEDPLMQESIGAVAVSSEIELTDQRAGLVNDFEKIYTDDQAFTLDTLIRNFQKHSAYEIAVVTLDSSWIPERSFDSLVVALHHKWGVGKTSKNTGVVIGISITNKKIRISTGNGLQAKLSDSETKQIIDRMIIPEFRNRNYYAGTLKGLNAITAKLK